MNVKGMFYVMANEAATHSRYLDNDLKGLTSDPYNASFFMFEENAKKVARSYEEKNPDGPQMLVVKATKDLPER
jgi:hypothetical protein